MTICSLPKTELFLYFSFLIGCFVYSTYQVYLAGEILVLNQSDTESYLAEGWFGYKKDVSHRRWDDWINMTVFTLSKWVATHLVLTQLTRWICPKGIPAVHSLITLSMICVHFGPEAASFMFIHVCFYFFTLQLNSVTKTWLLGLPFTTVLTVVLHTLWKIKGREMSLFTRLVVSTMWQHMRCTSFVFDHLNPENKLTKSRLITFYNLIGYCFYLPTYFIGPLILYSDFGPYMYHSFKKLTLRRIGLLVLNSLRFLFWAAVLEISLHFLYIHALKHRISEVALLGIWTFDGLGVLLGIFFNLFLIVFYGLGNTFASFDGYNPPPPPKCMLHYHLYTDIWRRLDVGFYKYMQKYVYLPLSRGSADWRRRILASAACFSFVIFWHGMAPIILIWCFLNWLVVLLVTVASAFNKSVVYQDWERHMFSGTNIRRLKALLAAPVLLMGSISSSFFVCDVQFGSFLIKEIFFNDSDT
ncbi:protein-cysteine N-palmitoyltransferase Rasp-like isoform X2 [Macrosteles quadrilineatus]|uniref:protein-cysteine N-palmitoyltransferase Rasp-like isoform X2 n=1 Tax=Macrosteles quadrilineatus TaxID=74068 RepID=UPI0023E183FF|nr:protein-cysteine N-palmitoyltransferase Rasp-like isoform X2 [Macrosteles quadrilineatus]